MTIYYLDELVLKAYNNKTEWNENNFITSLKIIEKNLHCDLDWDYGENWCRFYSEDSLIAMLCFPIPFIISNSNNILKYLPFTVELLVINSFDDDKVIISKPCQNLIEPMSQELETPSFIQDFYFVTV
ncbi:hypothetical protein [Neisseria yangbaofengii]|uniref:hypothetical protein n=1 Tax=Neisseria yangbaofengii TaxID=2709396 RepID=UPI0013EC4449|nr:hypothetical protein [Neisseria yangbaofengii]